MGRPKRRPDLAKLKGIAIRGSEEWRDWIHRLAESRERTVTDLINDALVQYARSHGFNEPAPKR